MVSKQVRRPTSLNNALSQRFAGLIKRSEHEDVRAMNKEASTASQSLGGQAAAKEEGLYWSQLCDAESARRYMKSAHKTVKGIIVRKGEINEKRRRKHINSD